MLEISGYHIKEQLYKSNSSIILKAERVSDSLPVILKVKEQSKNEIEHEIEILKSFNNDSIVQIVETLNIENKNIIILEDDNATSLKTWLNGKTLSIDELIDIAIKIVNAFNEVHLKGIIHNNINPSNIIICPETEQIRLIGFSKALQLSKGYPFPKNYKNIKEAIDYMAPEQSRPTYFPIDFCSDLYSIGVVLYELLTGKLPFTSDDILELTHAHFIKTPEPLYKIKPEIPQILSQIILKLLEKNTADRYQSTYGLLVDLKKFKNGINEYHLGEQDYLAVFKMSKKLYGREKEIEHLNKIFEDVSKGGSEFVVVTGYSGVGKSSVVNEILKTVIEYKGLFVSGKFDQYESITPYTAIKQAFGFVIRQILSEPLEVLNVWKSKLQNALNINGQIILDVIPDLELIIGKQKPVQQLGPVESKERFMRVFLDFVRVFTKPENALVLFLDDVQWIDYPTLDLIKLLITKRTPNLFIIAAYRDNEVSTGHPLLTAINELRQSQTIHQLHLEPLTSETLNTFIADTFQQKAENIKDLSSFIFQKTNGNPFFAKELITNLYKDGHILFNHTKAAWQWNLDKIKTISIEGNVVSFMIERLKKLAKPYQEVLWLAACIGNQFDLNSLALVLKKNREHIFKLLLIAINEGLITLLNDTKEGPVNTKVEAEGNIENITYKFSHDRVQQAAYSLIEKDKRAETHLKIGTLLLQNYGVDNIQEHIVEIVRHLNNGINLLKNPEERERLADLNLQVGIKAQNASAFHSALQYFKTGLDLLPENKWEKLYGLTFSLHREFAQSAFFADNFEEADAYCKLLLNKAKTKIEKANVYSLQSAYYVATGDYGQSIKSGIKGLSILGYSLPEKPGKHHIILEVLRIKWRLVGKKVSELYNAPVITESRLKLIMRILTEVSYAGSLADRNMQILTGFKMVSLSLRYGYTAESAPAFANYALGLIAAFGDYKNAAKYSELSLYLNDRFPDIREKTIVISLTSMINTWYDHWSLLTERFQKAIEYGYQSGDKFMFSRVAQMKVMFNPSMNLKDVSEEQYKNTKIIKETAFLEDSYNSSLLFYYMILNFQGLTKERFSFNYENFNEIQLYERIKEKKYFPGIVVYNLFKAEACLLYAEFYKGLEYIQEATKFLKYMPPIPYIVRHSFLVFILNSKCYSEMSKREQKQAVRKMNKEYKKMKKWARRCPVNFLHLLLMMDAEKERLSGHFDNTAKLFEKAIEKAEEGQWKHDEAMAYELLADMYLQNKHIVAAKAYLEQAYSKYDAWGAHGKTAQLRERWPDIFIPDEDKDASESFTGTSTSAQSLDIAAIVKASQAISGKITPEMLFRKMMQVLVENAGAQKGYLILNSDNELFIEASFSENEIQVLQHVPVEDCGDLAQSVINYVSRSQKVVVLDDARNKGLYTKDAYIEINKIKSLITLPIMRQKELNGLLYLENNLITSAFTIEQQEVLNILSSQIAISIENASLYSQLEKKVTARTRELKAKNLKYEALNEDLSQANEELRTIKEKVEESEARFRDIVYSSNDWVWEINQKGEYTYVSEQIKSILGFEPEEIIGKTPFHLMPDNETTRIRAIFDKIITEKGKIIDLENLAIHKNGTPVLLLTNGVPVLDKDGELLGYRGVDKDITHLKEAEQQLKEKNKELIALDDFKRTMTGAFVHDLKNPLNTIINRATSTSLQIAGKQMLNMVMNILDVYKYEDRTMQIELSRISIYEVVRNSVNEVAFLAKQKDIKIESNVTKKIEVNVDEKIIERVLINLLSNATKYSIEKALIAVNTVRNKRQGKKEELVIKVKDNGAGIRKEVREKIFERFVQLEAKNSGTAPSTGMGLTFCKLAIEAHGGDIGVESELGKGSTFWFTIPNARVIDVNDEVNKSSIINTGQLSFLPFETKQIIKNALDNLDSLEVYFITKIKVQIMKIKELELKELNGWIKEIDTCLEQCNNEKYHELLTDLRLGM